MTGGAMMPAIWPPTMITALPTPTYSGVRPDMGTAKIGM